MRIFISLLVLSLFASCSREIKQEDLYGRWNYVKVDNSNPQDTLPEGELESQLPAIIFSPGNKLLIEWGGKKLSSGVFRLDGKMIRYTEDLPEGQKREFPFLINRLDEKELEFQTMERNTTTVLARKAE